MISKSIHLTKKNKGMLNQQEMLKIQKAKEAKKQKK